MNPACTEFYPAQQAAFSLGISRVLFAERSPFQKIDIVESPFFGRVLMLDDMMMVTERDEFVYHEMIAHVPLFVHPRPADILVVGGGDGGTVRECLRHPAVERIDLVEIDEMVTQACLKHIPAVAEKLLSEKVSCHFTDGIEYVRSAARRYDLVLIDSTDPVSVGEGLFTQEFYRNCFKILKDDGILVNQSESPAWHVELVARISQKLRSVFPQVHFYQAHTPTYPSGHWLFGFASKKYHPLNDFRADYYRQSQMRLKYYNDQLHRGAFALPTFAREAVDEA